MFELTDVYAAFEKWPEDKKKRLIDAGIEEFADRGYDRASTDAIACKAGISKGLLFHYFKSKKNLYLNLVRYAVAFITEKTAAEVENIDTDDFFEWMKTIALAKQKIGLRYERETRFVTKAFADPPPAVRDEIESMYRERRETVLNSPYWIDFFKRKLMSGGRLRNGVSPDSVVRLTMAAVEDLSNRYWTMHKNGQFDLLRDPAPLIREMDEYFRIIRYGVCKPDMPDRPSPDRKSSEPQDGV